MWRLGFAGGAMCSAAAYRVWQSSDGAPPLPRSHAPAAMKKSAIVLGATGASGQQVVRELALSEQWSKVTTVSRRGLKNLHGLRDHNLAKLQCLTLDFDTIKPSDLSNVLQDLCSGHDVVFVCLGTTRSLAGSPEAFKKVEVDYTFIAAQAAHKAGVSHALVISAQGADQNMWVPSESIHPLFYIRTLGQKEQAVLEQGFDRVSIIRPGMLDRLNTDRWIERLVTSLGLGLRVDTLARCMVRAGASEQVGDVEVPVVYEGNKLIASCGSNLRSF